MQKAAEKCKAKGLPPGFRNSRRPQRGNQNAKFAVRGFSLVLAQELAPLGAGERLPPIFAWSRLCRTGGFGGVRRSPDRESHSAPCLRELEEVPLAR
jgi:hypothetical protein